MLIKIILAWYITNILAPYTYTQGLQNKHIYYSPSPHRWAKNKVLNDSDLNKNRINLKNFLCYSSPGGILLNFITDSSHLYKTYYPIKATGHKFTRSSLFTNYTTVTSNSCSGFAIHNQHKRHQNSTTIPTSTPSSSKIISGLTPKPPTNECTPILDTIKFPRDLKKLSLEELKKLSHELRWDLINKISKTGGHFSASLGVIELTIALHYVFDTPEDKLVWDVSHQAYAHKILTGRRELMHTLRKKGGLSGFTKKEESVYDPFGAGHSSTSISAAQGISIARTLLGKNPNRCIAVIGDGGITGGMAFEAMNSVGFLRSNVIVILNDNGQVSLPTGSYSAGGTGPAGALSSYTARLLTSRGFQNFRNAAKRVTQLFPDYLRETAAKIDEYSRGILTGGTLFEEFGFYYVGPADGHDIENLITILKNIKKSDGNKPILLHIKTHKGFGYDPAMKAMDKMHGVLGFDIATGNRISSSTGSKTLTETFSAVLSEIGRNDQKVVAITAAMPGGTGLSEFGKLFPNRTFDVGIAEQHAVTFAGGLASEGLKPFCCIYSTFLQRAYDQIIHDICLQNLPVRFIIDRAGLVGPDGATHQGAYDLTYLGTIPNLIIMAPSDEVELINMIETAYKLESPSAIRFPRLAGYGIDYLNKNLGYNLTHLPIRGNPLEIGKGRIIYEQESNRSKKVAILSIGTRLAESVKAAKQIESQIDNIQVTVADARFMKPLDKELIQKLANKSDVLITIEEGSIGGFGSHVFNLISLKGLIDRQNFKFRNLHIPDKFIEHGKQEEQYEECALTSHHIVNYIKDLIK